METFLSEDEYIRRRLRLFLGAFRCNGWCIRGSICASGLTDFLRWADWLGYHVRALIPYQGTPFLKRPWPNLFAGGIVYVLEFKE